MKNNMLTTLIFTLLTVATISNYAAEKMDISMSSKSSKTSVANKIITGKGQVVLISKDKTKVTLRHEPIPAIRWPAMTMEFKVKSGALLAKTKVGDKVQFTLVPNGIDYIVTSIK